MRKLHPPRLSPWSLPPVFAHSHQAARSSPYRRARARSHATATYSENNHDCNRLIVFHMCARMWKTLTNKSIFWSYRKLGHYLDGNKLPRYRICCTNSTGMGKMIPQSPPRLNRIERFNIANLVVKKQFYQKCSILFRDVWKNGQAVLYYRFLCVSPSRCRKRSTRKHTRIPGCRRFVAPPQREEASRRRAIAQAESPLLGGGGGDRRC